MGISPDNLELNQIFGYLKKLEARIERLEAYFNLGPAGEAPEIELPPPSSAKAEESEDRLELQIGENWLAKTGIVVLAAGIAFLLALPYKNLPPILPGILGYCLAAGIFALSHYWRKSFSLISRYLHGGGMALMYFATLRLYFFSAEKAVTKRSLEIVLLMIIVFANFYISGRRKSIYLAGLSLAMGYTTAIVSDQAYFLFAAAALMSALVVYFKLKYGWQRLLIFGIVLTYFTHFLWFLNNPFLGKNLQFVSSPETNLLFVLLYVLIFAAGNFVRDKSLPESNMVIITTFLNCAGGYSLFLLISVIKFQEHIAMYHLLAALVFLGLAIAYWSREKSKFSTFFYAMTGYSALSVAIIARFSEPESLVWLGWQSLLVISTAVWFRSKFIIVANFIIYLLIFLVYLILAKTVTPISLSFGVVALMSARILNWQKDRLELKTELMRNAYLAAAFFMFPYTLYHIVPAGYVSLSWLGVGIIYYILSRVLNNRKYRWMALFTLLLTVGHVLLIDATRLDPALRVISFLVVGAALVVISIFYSRSRLKSP